MSLPAPSAGKAKRLIQINSRKNIFDRTLNSRFILGSAYVMMRSNFPVEKYSSCPLSSLPTIFAVSARTDVCLKT
jgi:hypothetical protein